MAQNAYVGLLEQGTGIKPLEIKLYLMTKDKLKTKKSKGKETTKKGKKKKSLSLEPKK